MTTQYAVFSGLPTGLTLTKKVFTVADPDTEVTGITGAITERTNAKGQYTVAVTKAAVITGIHTIILFVGSTPIAIGKRTFAGTDAETAVETPVIVELDSEVTDQLAAILAAVEAIEAGGLTTEQADQLSGILDAVQRIRGPALNWTGNVGPGGVLQLTVGDDHDTVIANDLPIRVKDPGGLLHAKLTAAGVSLQWSAGQGTTGGMITGTVTTPTHDEETTITTIIVQVPNCAATGNILAPYKWQLQRTISGRRARMLQGSLNLNPDMIGA